MYVNVKENMKLEFFYSIDAFQYSKKEKKKSSSWCFSA